MDQTMPDGSEGAVYKMVTPTFAVVGGGSTEMNINEFKVKGSADYMTSIQVMDSSGQWDAGKESTWFNDYYDGDTLVAPAGWYSADGMTKHEFNLEPGESMFFSTQEDGLTVTIPAAIKE